MNESTIIYLIFGSGAVTVVPVVLGVALPMLGIKSSRAHLLFTIYGVYNRITTRKLVERCELVKEEVKDQEALQKFIDMCRHYDLRSDYGMNIKDAIKRLSNSECDRMWFAVKEALDLNYDRDIANLPRL